MDVVFGDPPPPTKVPQSSENHCRFARRSQRSENGSTYETESEKGSTKTPKYWKWIIFQKSEFGACFCYSRTLNDPWATGQVSRLSRDIFWGLARQCTVVPRFYKPHSLEVRISKSIPALPDLRKCSREGRETCPIAQRSFRVRGNSRKSSKFRFMKKD